MAIILDKTEKGYIEYNVQFLNPRNLSVLNNKIASDIVKEISISPMCAMDLARKLDQHEQKIYYHLNKLQKSGIVKLVGTEKRYGMVAQLYDLVSPVVAAKLNSSGGSIREYNNGSDFQKNVSSIMEPFVDNGKLNSTIVIGNTQPHGKYGEGAREGSYIGDISMLIGRLVDDIPVPSYKFDTQITEKDLMGNLILIGNPKTNVIIEKIIENSKIKFDLDNDHIVSEGTGKTYKDKNIGLISLFENPLNHRSKVLLLGGKQARGTRAAIIGFVKNVEKLSSEINDSGELFKVVAGYDRDSDYEIDDTEFLE